MSHQHWEIYRSTCIELRFEPGFEIKPPHHTIHQVIPTLKNHGVRQSPNIVEKGLAFGKHMANQGILVITSLQDGLKKKRQQIDAEHTRREVFLAVTKVLPPQPAKIVLPEPRAPANP